MSKLFNLSFVIAQTSQDIVQRHPNHTLLVSSNAMYRVLDSESRTIFENMWQRLTSGYHNPWDFTLYKSRQNNTYLLLISSNESVERLSEHGELFYHVMLDTYSDIDNSMKVGTYSLIKAKHSIETRIDSTQRVIDRQRTDYLSNLNLINELRNKLESIIGNYRKIQDKYKIGPEGVLFTFEDVIAEDTEARGDDINLGTVEFSVSLDGKVKITGGDDNYIRHTEYNDKSRHPHMMSDGVCLGSQSADLMEAVSGYNFDIVHAMLHKFVTSYTSNDSAGRWWRAWTEEGMTDEDNDCYVPTRDEYYHDDEVRWSEYRNEYIHENDAVWSDYENDWLYNDDEFCLWTYDDAYIRNDHATELHNGDYACDDDNGLITLHDGRYTVEHFNDHVVLTNDEFALTSEAIELADGTFIAKDDERLVELEDGSHGAIGLPWVINIEEDVYVNISDVVMIDDNYVRLSETIIGDDGTLMRASDIGTPPVIE